MNLRKANKAQLILEIKRLRQYEKQVKDLCNEIKRRDNATAKYNEIQPVAILYAHELANAQTNKEQQQLWENFWQFAQKRIEEKRTDEFWMERCADLISDYTRKILHYRQFINASKN